MNVKTGKRILLLGGTGKLGRAFAKELSPADEVITHNSRTFDAGNFDQVRAIVRESRPDIVLNTVAFLGIDPCEREPEKALRINSLYPRVLAECAAVQGFILAHVSTDAVFPDRAEGAYGESDVPAPVNIYGLTKYGGDCFVRDLAPRSYIFRISLLVGQSDREDQFVERMLGRIRRGEKTLRIADDIVISPSYAPDVAAVAVRLMNERAPFGIYHLANSGVTSLYGVMKHIVEKLRRDVHVEPGSHRDFPAVGKKNTRTPILSEKIPSLRPWEDALDEYCRLLAADWRS